jgi:PAS domain S-box-containing protein
MTLRRKAVLLIGATLVILVGVIYVVSRFVFIEGLESIEEEDAQRHVAQAEAVLSSAISNLVTVTTQWAAWDETYEFIQSSDELFVRSNLTDETFLKLNLNLVAFINPASDIVYAKALDLRSAEELPVSHNLEGYLRDSSFLASSELGNSTSGILLLDEGPMMVAAQPILTTSYEGPVQGTLVFGRYLDSVEIERLSQTTLHPIAIYRISQASNRGDPEALTSLVTGAQVFVKPLNNQYIAGYKLIDDIFGKKNLMLKVNVPREIYSQGIDSVIYHILAVFGVSLGVTAIALLVAEKQILSGLVKLVTGVTRIADSGDISARLQVASSDEIGTVTGAINGMLGALQQAESDVRQSEAHYRLLADNASDVIFTTDIGLKITYVSPSIQALTGYSPDEATDLTIDQIFTPVSTQLINEVISEAGGQVGTAAHSTPSATLELKAVTKEGSTIWLEIGATLLRDAQNRPIGILGVARDITERKHASEELEVRYENERKLRQELEEEIAKRIEYTRALVHELKTPLTPVVASSELLLEESQETGTQRLAENIYQGANNLSRRIDELLDLARSEIGSLEVHPEEVEPAGLLNNIVSEITPLSLRYRQLLEIEIPSSLPIIWADPDRFQQIVLNLLNNALKYSPPETEIILRAREEAKNLIVEVQDEGPGISEEEQKRLFEPYHRTESDRARLSGLGLGLALSKTIVELQGGEIWVKSRKGEGSTFSFSLPLAKTKRKVAKPGTKP